MPLGRMFAPESKKAPLGRRGRPQGKGVSLGKVCRPGTKRLPLGQLGCPREVAPTVRFVAPIFVLLLYLTKIVWAIA